MFIASFIDQKISLRNGQNRSPLFGAYVIISESMVPHINVYDAVVTVRVDENSIQVDDIITFLSKEIETAGTPITHRVIGIVYEDDTKQKIIGFRTKGDHNNTADFALIAPNEVIGKVFLRIPMIGYLQTIMTKPIGWLLIVVIPCLLIIGSDILKLIKNTRQKDIEERQSTESPISDDSFAELPKENAIPPIPSVSITEGQVEPINSATFVSNSTQQNEFDENLSSNTNPMETKEQSTSNTTINSETSSQSSSDTNHLSDSDQII